jgi:hypothetical protein
MEPRRKTNKKTKSTSIPAEYLKNIKSVFTKAFKERLAGREIFVEGRLFPSELILCVGYLPDPEGLRQTNFEASIDHGGKDVFEKMGICIDALSSLMDQYLESSETLELPREWTPYDFEKHQVFLRTSARNTVLENEANRILGVDSNDALYTEGEDPLEDLAKKSEGDDEYRKTIEQVNEKLRKKKREDLN